jgi:GRAM domain
LFSYFNDPHAAYNLLKSLWDKTKITSTLNNTEVSGKRLLHRKPMDTSSVSISPVEKGSSPGGSGKDVAGTKPPRLNWVPVQKTSVEIQLKGPNGNSADGEIKSHRKSLSSSSPTSASVPDFREYSPGGTEVRNSTSEDGNRPIPSTDSNEKRKSWWATHRKTSSDGGEPYIPEDIVVTEEKNELFKSHFAIPQTERLLQTFSAYINKVLPLLGKIYVSSNYICFKSVRVGFRVKAVISLADIKNIELRKCYSPFVYTMVIFPKDADDEVI